MITSGIVGGVFAAAASHPFDTIKTRMQVGRLHCIARSWMKAELMSDHAPPQAPHPY
jgi:hypothetical protein